MKDESPKRKNSRDLKWSEALVQLFPGIIIPEQMYAGGEQCSQPEHELLAAVMDNAMDDIRGMGVGKEKKYTQQLADDARVWVLDNVVRIFSFIYCCQHLNLDVGRTRRAYLNNYLKGRMQGEERWRLAKRNINNIGAM